DMTDEGYNCEWSQELKLDQSFNEYLKAFVLIYVLRDLLKMTDESLPEAAPGFCFNMSAGYNLEGIRSPSVQRFFDRMEDCAADVEQLKRELAPLYPRILDLAIPGRLSDNLTVSTMHGCPPEEVESIGRYFITERHYHTTIKLNPTLLGAKRLRYILNTHLGFDTVVPDAAFAHDLKYAEGVTLIKNLRDAAQKAGVSFSLKLTNTLETLNTQQNLPQHERMVYMSGRALHPVSIHLAERLQQEFDGTLDISFSAGVDAFNVADVLACGLRPLTVCSDLLKPGGYARLRQYLDAIRHAATRANAHTLDELAAAKAPQTTNPGFANLVTYAADLIATHSRYHKDAFPFKDIKIDRPLPRFDCATAPCMASCPTGQDIPRYLEATARGDFALAWQIILATNPFARTQGMVCDHPCQSRCTRLNYDKPLLIREIKRFIAQHHTATGGQAPLPAPACGKKVAIIGAGPSGLSCAHFLALQGVAVTLYEAKPFPGGMASDAIPAFRLDNASLASDIQAILDLGVTLHTGVTVNATQFEALCATSDAVYVATGAPKSLPLGIPGETAAGVIDQLRFLSTVRRTGTAPIGTRVLVIGAGNAAVDTARTVRRLHQQRRMEAGEVTIVYRRTRKEMPAALEEMQDALAEGVKLVELCAPDAVLQQDGKVVGLRGCCMQLEDDPHGGRPRPVKKEGMFQTLPADTLIVCIGQEVGTLASTVRCHKEQRSDTTLSNVFVGGDAQRGASSLINAVGDGRKAAASILAFMGVAASTEHAAPPDDRTL
ncbi:MAG: FAD-dependent oxidoreductase, partial [Bilophila sp.]